MTEEGKKEGEKRIEERHSREREEALRKEVEWDGEEGEERKQKTKEATFLDQEKKAIRSKRIKKVPCFKTAQKETFSENTLLALYLNIFPGQGSTSMFRGTIILQSKNYPISRVGSSEWHGRWKIYCKHLPLRRPVAFLGWRQETVQEPSLYGCLPLVHSPPEAHVRSLLGRNPPSIRVQLH